MKFIFLKLHILIVKKMKTSEAGKRSEIMEEATGSGATNVTDQRPRTTEDRRLENKQRKENIQDWSLTRIQFEDEPSSHSHQNAKDEIVCHQKSPKSFKDALCGSEAPKPFNLSEEIDGNLSTPPVYTGLIPSISISDKEKNYWSDSIIARATGKF